MALNEMDKSWVREQIQKAHEKHGWGRFTEFVKNWFGVGVAVTLLVMVGTTWTKYVEFRTKTSDRLEHIEGTLDKIDLALTKTSLIEHAVLPLEELKTTLPDVASAATKARERNLKVPLKVVNDLAQKLKETDTNAPSYWRAASAIISYRSSLLVGNSQNWMQFPPCQIVPDLAASPDAKVQIENREGKVVVPPFTPSSVQSHNCYVELDGRTIARWDCTHCVVKYSGGPVSLTNVHFENCLFIFDLSDRNLPQPNGQRLGELLLASDLSDIKIQSL